MQFPMQTRANEMNTTREIKNSNGFAIFITFLFGTLDVFRSGRDLAQPSRPVGKPATRKLRTNGKGERAEHTRGCQRRQGRRRRMRQRRSSCGYAVNHDGVKDEMKGTRNTGEKIYNARRRREVGRQGALYSSRATHPSPPLPRA